MDNSTERKRTVTWDDPMVGATAARTMAGLDYLQAVLTGTLPTAPIAHLLGFSLSEISAGRAVFTLTPAEYHYNPIGSVHGGVASTLLDSALGCAVHSMLPSGTGYATIELHINLLRPLTRDTGPVRAEAEIIHLGKNMATAQARLVDEAGKIYAHGTTTCLLMRIAPEEQPS